MPQNTRPSCMNQFGRKLARQQSAIDVKRERGDTKRQTLQNGADRGVR